MPRLDIHQFSCLKDNYGVLVHDRESGETVSIDAPEAGAVEGALEVTGWKLTGIFVTHHHADHTGGIARLKAATRCKVIGPAAEASRIPELDQGVAEGDRLSIGRYEVRVLDTPGHTVGHVCYFIPEARVVFVGDTLFAMGCGRVLEGNHEMMWNSLRKLSRLPDETAIYCGHEYTLANAQFGLNIEPENVRLRERAREVEQARSAGKPTLPTTVSLELATNVFLRPHVSAIRNRLGMRVEADWRVFGAIRERKNKA
jgi:hydroxyacylglutathione hydrolase